MKQNKKLFWLVTAISLVISVISTFIIETYLTKNINIVGSFISLHASQNRGVAFGINMGTLQPILIAFALCFAFYIALKHASSILDCIGFGLIIGGGIANIIDRIQDSTVTDVFKVGSFPIFNVADSCITVGVCLLLIQMFIGSNRIFNKSKV
ncbi:MAG: signal peptidase II [Candidatus Peribacteraceae bacterium]|nr:signal peptidase II [Candidatus Peribacteraceae bacterium]